MATVLVLVNMVGTGIFLIPVSMASVGSISIYGWMVATVGAAAIGSMFAMPGGPYAYARDSLGPYLGFQTNYVYWSANLVGNIAVATTVTGYFAELVPIFGGEGREAMVTIVIIWAVATINIAGPCWVGFCTGYGTVLAMIPLAAIAVGGWFWSDLQIFLGSWNLRHDTAWSGVSQSAAFALWAFMGGRERGGGGRRDRESAPECAAGDVAGAAHRGGALRRNVHGADPRPLRMRR